MSLLTFSKFPPLAIREKASGATTPSPALSEPASGATTATQAPAGAAPTTPPGAAPHPPKASAAGTAATDPSGRAIADRLGLRFDGLEHWPSENDPGQRLWAFTDRDPRSITHGITFYVAPGSSYSQVARRLQEKRDEVLVPSVA